MSGSNVVELLPGSADNWHYDTVMAAPAQAPSHVRRELADNCLYWAQTALLNDDMVNAMMFADKASLLLSFEVTA